MCSRQNENKHHLLNASTLPINTEVGSISHQVSNVCLALHNHPDRENIRSSDRFPTLTGASPCPKCYVCSREFLSGNGLQSHLQTTCYPQEMRDYLNNLTNHIEHEKQRDRLKQVLCRHGKLFDIRTPSVINTTLKHAIDTGNHKPV